MSLKKTSFSFCLILFLLMTFMTKAYAANVIIHFYMDTKVDEERALFIFVNGKIAGAMPGTISVPLDDKGAAIEIGFPYLRHAPIYSMSLSKKSIHRGVLDVVISNFLFFRASEQNPNSKLTLQANKPLEIAIPHPSEGVYFIKLPNEPYEKLLPFFRWGKPAKFHYDDLSTSQGVDHIAYNVATGRPDFLSRMRSHWSGATTDTEFFNPGIGVPFKRWNIQSTPPEATVKSDMGLQGVTQLELDLKMSHGFFLVLQKSGYLDCPSSQCTKVETDSTVNLQCRLKKIHSKRTSKVSPKNKTPQKSKGS